MSGVNFYLLNALASTNPKVGSKLKTLLGQATQKTKTSEEAKESILKNATFVKELIAMLNLPESQRSSFTESTLKALSKKTSPKNH